MIFLFIDSDKMKICNKLVIIWKNCIHNLLIYDKIAIKKGNVDE